MGRARSSGQAAPVLHGRPPEQWCSNASVQPPPRDSPRVFLRRFSFTSGRLDEQPTSGPNTQSRRPSGKRARPSAGQLPVSLTGRQQAASQTRPKQKAKNWPPPSASGQAPGRAIDKLLPAFRFGSFFINGAAPKRPTGAHLGLLVASCSLASLIACQPASLLHTSFRALPRLLGCLSLASPGGPLAA